MVYFIIGILILLFYVFAVPASIKGTLNILTIVLLLVALIILFALGLFQIFKLPSEFFVGLFLMILTVWALRDIERLKSKVRRRDFVDENHYE
ncbi:MULTISPECIES: DUF3165 family protein [Streptococcus]|uniref:DUF3165 family protein n=1 Tax=Streptococcus TaxID=1301 RepID=UPI001C2E3336|nr:MULTISPECIES: DUF3165 family protein [Streptococcus]MCD1277360.1 hypothetical protein [Streptococcus sinensis]MCY7217690.1 DUF3165 family protein [Streptococcus cristatus]